MEKPELNKKTLKELRGELLTKKNNQYWQSESEQQKPGNIADQFSESDNDETEEEGMGM